MSKSIKALLMILCLLTTLNYSALAQQSLFNGCSSAGRLNQPVWFNCDLRDTMGFSADEAVVHYMAQGGTSFSHITMTAINEAPYYTDTYEASIVLSENPNNLQYYFSADSDSLRATQSPKNTNNQFPPSMYKYAPFANDPIGDAESPAGNWLDLTGSGMTYSDTRIYGYLENVGGTWPLSEGYFTYFAYGLGFVVTAGDDSVFYALAYADVPLLLSTGLYKIGLSDSSFTQIGNISASVTGSRLHMACDFSEFESDPDWPGWPPPDGFLVSMGASITAGLSSQTFNDFTTGTFYEPLTLYEDFNTNTAPVLDSYSLELDPDVGIDATVNYLDSDNNLPLISNLYLDFSTFDMNSYDHIYSDDSEFETSLSWPGDGLYYYYFEFSDGVDTVTTPLDSIEIGTELYEYLPGDVTMYSGGWPPNIIGADVTYFVNFFRGFPTSIPCYLDGFWCSADCNGDCVVIGSDITKLVNYFRGQTDLSYCPDYPTAWPTPEFLPPGPPPGWPNCDVIEFNE